VSSLDKLVSRLCPDGVEFLSLGDLGALYAGLSGKSKADFTGGNARYVSYMNVFGNPVTEVLPADLVTVSAGERQNRVHAGDVLFTVSSETPAEVGMASVVMTEPPEPLYLNSFCLGWRPTSPTRLDPSFAKHLFRSPGVRRQIIATANGVTRINISRKPFLAVRVPVPPLEVQRAVAAPLDLMQGLLAQLEAELLRRKAQFRQVLQSMLIDGNDAESRWGTLGELGKVSMCKRVFKHETSPQGDVPFYKIGTFGGQPDAFISQELYDSYRERYPFPKPGDVLISAAGTIGRAVIYDGKPAYFQDSNIVWLDNDERLVTNRFLHHWLRVIRWDTDDSTIRRLYNENLRQARIRIPSLGDQSRLAEALDAFDTLVNDTNSGLPAEIAARRKQYEYYRDKFLTFPEKPSDEAAT
jgi:type I restriction enzyme, S subunit